MNTCVYLKGLGFPPLRFGLLVRVNTRLIIWETIGGEPAASGAWLGRGPAWGGAYSRQGHTECDSTSPSVPDKLPWGGPPGFTGTQAV